MSDEVDWLVLGDFNLIIRPENRNKEGGNIMEMLLFNEAISAFGLNEITLQGRKYTWSNKQTSPLLEKLDWAFTSNSWALSYPDTSLTPLDMFPSDHCPCIVRISSHIPKNATLVTFSIRVGPFPPFRRIMPRTLQLNSRI